MNLENVKETKEMIQKLMTDLENPGCDEKNVSELKEILEKIGSNKNLMAKYEDIYADAADALMLAGISADDCKCDPLRKHIPTSFKDSQ